MRAFKLFLMVLPFVLLTSSCGKDDVMDPTDPDPDPDPVTCKFLGVDIRADESTTFGVFSVEYDENDQIVSGGLQTFDFTYDSDGKLIQALLEGSSFNPRVDFDYTYNGDQIDVIKSTWGEEPNLEERYIYQVNYGTDGFVSNVNVSGTFSPSELFYTFDANGNPTSWTDPVFEDVTTYAFDTSKKGLFEDLDHTLAFAYGIALGQPFFHFRNAVAEERSGDSDEIFSEATFNDAGFQTTAKNPNVDGKEYIFEYECE